MLYWSMQIVCRTLRFDFRAKDHFDRTKQQHNVLFAVWHQATFVMFYLYRRKKVCILVSAETRGQVLGKCAAWMGYTVVPVPLGEGRFESARGLARMIKLIKQGYDAVIAVDGPTGPLFQIKPGVFYLSQKGKVPIIPVEVEAPRRLTLFWRWDKYFVPLPFSRVSVRLGRPLF